MKHLLSPVRPFLSAGLLFGLAASASAASFTWNETTASPPNHLWNNPGNWNSTEAGVPGVGDTAWITPTLTGAINITFNAFGTSGDPDYIPANPSVGILNVGDAGGIRTITFGPGGASNYLAMDNGSAEAQINKTSAALVNFQRPLRFASNTVLSVSAGELRISGGQATLSQSGNLAIEGAGYVDFYSTATSASFSTGYNGEVAIRSNGTLLVNNTFAASTTVPAAAVKVENTGHLGGAGTMGRTTTIESGGTLRPGAGLTDVGLLTFSGGLKLNTDSHFQFDLRGDTTAGRGTAFSGVNVTAGALTVEAGAVFNLTFNGTGSTVDFTSAFWDGEQEWLVFSNAEPASVGAFALGTVSADSLGNAFSATGGAFGFKQVGNDTYLTYTAVPEPGTTAFVFGAAALAIALRWKSATK